MLQNFQVDDPLEASSVHFAGGIWGCMATGLFASKGYVAEVYGIEPTSWGLLRGGGFGQFGVQVCGVKVASGMLCC